jgi:hypothetical protein
MPAAGPTQHDESVAAEENGTGNCTRQNGTAILKDFDVARVASTTSGIGTVNVSAN